MGGFTKEHIHLLQARSGGMATSLRCFSCQKELPANRFEVLPVHPGMSGDSARARLIRVLHPHCGKCRSVAARRRERNPLYSNELRRYWQAATIALRHDATRRGTAIYGTLVGIDADDIVDIYLRQDGRCALTGERLDIRARGGKGPGNRAAKAPSLDRIDTTANFTRGNIIVVASRIRSMKGNLSVDDFIDACGNIARRNLVGEFDPMVA